MRVKLLPHYYKNIGFLVALVTFILLVFSHFNEDIHYLKTLVAVGKPVFLISLLIMAFAQDKQETDDLDKLRFKHLKDAIVFVTSVLIINQIVSLFTGNYGPFYTGNELLSFLLIIYLIHYNFSRFMRK